MSRFHAVYDKLNRALDEMPYEQLGISEEVKEQVMLPFSFSFHTFLSSLLSSDKSMLTSIDGEFHNCFWISVFTH